MMYKTCLIAEPAPTSGGTIEATVGALAAASCSSRYGEFSYTCFVHWPRFCASFETSTIFTLPFWSRKLLVVFDSKPDGSTYWPVVSGDDPSPLLFPT